jgi:hypothetical protein
MYERQLEWLKKIEKERLRKKREIEKSIKVRPI